MSNEYLPEDMVLQILLWLPVVSLLRFKCVCKSWYALITSKTFITKHLLHRQSSTTSKKNKNTHFLVHRCDKTSDDYVMSLLSYETLHISLTQALPLSYEVEMDTKTDIIIVGSCNGLVCLNDNYNLILAIWNPATKETNIVPKSRLPCPPRLSPGTNDLGFGFDPKTDDYKIVRIVTWMDLRHEVSEYDAEMINQVEVYSSNTKSWKKLDTDLPYCIINDSSCTTYTKGMYSWWTEIDHYTDAILSFDMSSEVFLTTPLPDHSIIGGSWNNERAFFVLNESVALAVTMLTTPLPDNEQETEKCIDIWLLSEFGVKESWTKLFTIGTLTGIRRPLGFWKNDNVFLEHTDDGQILLYDPSTEEMTSLQIDGVPNSLQMVTYIETLVSVKGGNRPEEQEGS